MKNERAHSFILLLAGMGIQSTFMGFAYLHWLTSNGAYQFTSRAVDAPVFSGSVLNSALRDEGTRQLTSRTDGKVQDGSAAAHHADAIPDHSRMTRGRVSSGVEQTLSSSRRTGVISQGGTNSSSSTSLSATAAIAMIAIGTSEKQAKLTRRCIRSIRKVGKYSGHILLVTDSMELANTVRVDDKVEVFRVDPETMIFDKYDHWKLSSVKRSAKAKRFKMRLLDMMDSKKYLDGYQWLLYLDIDVVIGKPLEPFFDYVERRTLGRDHSVDKVFDSYLLSFHEDKKWEGDQQCAHSGIVLLDRRKSRRCLSLWERSFRSGEHRMDQSALASVVCNRTVASRNDCGVGYLSNKRFLLKPTKETMEEGRSATFIHITSTNKANPSKKAFIPWKLQVHYLTKVVGLEENIAVPAHKKKKGVE